MGSEKDDLLLEHERAGKRLKVTARWRGEPQHSDIINPAIAATRRRFAAALAKKVPSLELADIDAELLRIADATARPADPAPAGGPAELDISRVVRPDLFITHDVCGLAVPVVEIRGGKPAARWYQYVRWADGRRECRELTSYLDLPGGAKLWVHPMPGEPSMTTAGGWSRSARRAWLDGSPAPEPAGLFRRLCERIAYFIDLPADVAAGTTATLALWSMFSYCYQAWDAVPYLYVGGPLSSGKSTVFGILSRLVYRPLASSNLTAAALFRTLHDRGGTLLYDEAERLRQTTPDVAEVLSMLLAGYRRGGQATRLEPVGDSFRSVAFDVYGPKALACIAGLPPALASRCIPIIMFRAGPDSPKPQRRIDADAAAWQSLRDDLHALALDHGQTWLDLSRRLNVCPAGIGGRAYELWQPLLALASWVESRGATNLLSLVQRFALDSIDAGREDAVPDADVTLLELLAEAVRGSEWPTPGELLTRAQDRDPGTFGKSNGSGPRWQPNTVTRRLKSYGIPAPRKSNGQRRFRDVDLGLLWRIQRNYGIDLDIIGFGTPDPSPQSPALTDPADPVGSANAGR